MKACMDVCACTIMLLAQNGTTHHLSVHPSEKSPAVPSLYLPLLCKHITVKKEAGGVPIFSLTAIKCIQF